MVSGCGEELEGVVLHQAGAGRNNAGRVSAMGRPTVEREEGDAIGDHYSVEVGKVVAAQLHVVPASGDLPDVFGVDVDLLGRHSAGEATRIRRSDRPARNRNGGDVVAPY